MGGYRLKTGFFIESNVRITRNLTWIMQIWTHSLGVLGGAYSWSLLGFRHEEQVRIGAFVASVEHFVYARGNTIATMPICEDLLPLKSVYEAQPASRCHNK